MKVIKRDGRKVEFDSNKIKKAVSKAYREVYPNEDTEKIEDYDSLATKNALESISFLKVNCIDIEKIQDTVENVLMNIDKVVAKAYITYRYRHTMERDEYKALMAEGKEKLSTENVHNKNSNVSE